MRFWDSKPIYTIESIHCIYHNDPWLTISSPVYFQNKMSLIFQTKTCVASRGYGYRCMHCTTIQGYRGEKRRVVSHIYKNHIPLTQSPFYCKVCLFRSVDQESLIRHCGESVYPAHRAKMLEFNTGRVTTVIDEDVLMRSTNPYDVREGTDFVRLAPEDSEVLWQERRKPEGVPILRSPRAPMFVKPTPPRTVEIPSTVQSSPRLTMPAIGDENVWSEIMSGFDPSEALTPMANTIFNAPPCTPVTAPSKLLEFQPRAPATTTAAISPAPYVPPGSSYISVPDYVPTTISSGLANLQSPTTPI